MKNVLVILAFLLTFALNTESVFAGHKHHSKHVHVHHHYPRYHGGFAYGGYGGYPGYYAAYPYYYNPSFYYVATPEPVAVPVTGAAFNLNLQFR